MSFTAYGERGEEAVEAAVQEVERLDALLSTGIAESEVSRINASGEGDLSEDTEKILSEGLTIWKQTGGLFDVTNLSAHAAVGIPDGKLSRADKGGTETDYESGGFFQSDS